jgi:uncharacterized protein
MKEGTRMHVQATPVLVAASRNRRSDLLHTLVLIVLVLFYLPFAAYICPPVEPLILAWGEIAGRTLHELPRWLYLGAVLLVFTRWAGRPLAELGVRKPTWDVLVWALLAIVGTFALALVAKAVVAGIPHPDENVLANAAELRWSLGYAAWVALRAGVVEECLFRAVLIEQLAVLCTRRWLAAILAGSIFVSVHALSFDWFQLLMAAAASVVLTLVYMRRRSLLASIVAHVLIDMIGFSHLLLKTNAV